MEKTNSTGLQNFDTLGISRNEKQFQNSQFPQLPTIGYGIVNGNGGATYVDTNVQHQPSASVSSSGSWSISRFSAGHYLVTHNLGTLSYLPFVQNLAITSTTFALVTSIHNLGMTSFEIIVQRGDTGAETDSNLFFYFVFGLP